MILFIMISAFHLNTVALASAANVKDCLESGEDCLQMNNNEKEANTGKAPSSTSSQNDSWVFYFIKLTVALVLVLGLIYLLLKFLNQRNRLFQQVKSMENLGGISVGPNKSIQLVRIGSKVFVVGVGENVEKLHEIEDEEDKKELLKQYETTKMNTASVLPAFLQKKEKQNSNADSEKNFKELFASELDKMKKQRRQLAERRKKEDFYE